MHQNVNAPLTLILAVVCWGVSAFYYPFYYAQPTPAGRLGYGLGVFPLGFFFYGLYLIFH